MQIIVTGIPRTGIGIALPYFQKDGVHAIRCYIGEASPLLEMFPDAKWILIRRDRRGTIQSCMKTGWMHDCTDPECWNRWHQEQSTLLEELKTQVDSFEVWPEKIIKKETEEILAALKWCGLL